MLNSSGTDSVVSNVPGSIKIKTTELIGPALDWAVAKCECFENWFYHEFDNVVYKDLETPFCPSTNYSQASTIINREIDIICRYTKEVWISIGARGAEGSGPTILIATMRCYVASKLGDEVDIPRDLA